MKRCLFTILAFCAALWVSAQTEITVEPGGTKIIRGFTNKEELSKDTAFKWFQWNSAGFTPDKNAVSALSQHKDSINIIAFGGTWCSDTQSLFPKFFSLTDAAGFSQERVTVIGVDRNKKTIEHLTEAFNVTRVPTFIVMKNGKEIGRVVEYGKYGMIDRELGEIVSKN